MTTDGNFDNLTEEQYELLGEAFTAGIARELEARAESMARRKKIREAGKALLKHSGEKFDGEKDKWYLGPDVDNDKIIFVTGPQANLPLEQMQRDGFRSSLRRPRVKRKYKDTSVASKFAIE